MTNDNIFVRMPNLIMKIGRIEEKIKNVSLPTTIIISLTSPEPGDNCDTRALCGQMSE